VLARERSARGGAEALLALPARLCLGDASDGGGGSSGEGAECASEPPSARPLLLSRGGAPGAALGGAWAAASPPQPPSEGFALPPAASPLRGGGATAGGASSTATTAATAARALTREVEVTPLSYVLGRPLARYLGCIHANFIRESLAVRAGGGLSAFTQLIIAEANAVLRAQAAALGANAALNYRLVPRESTLRQAAYVLVSISADAVELAPE